MVLNSTEEFVSSTGLYPYCSMRPAKSSAYGRSAEITGQDPEKLGPMSVYQVSILLWLYMYANSVPIISKRDNQLI